MPVVMLLQFLSFSGDYCDVVVALFQADLLIIL